MSDERDTLRERIAAAWSHARCSVAHDPSACSTCALFALLDSPVGEPEPDALREAEAVMRSACILLTDDLQRGDGVLTVEKVREAYTLLFDFLHTDIYRRSKLSGAVISEPGKGWVHVGPVDEGFDSLHDEVEATTVGSVEIDEPICERCGQRQPLVSMHFCGGKSAALFRVEFTADTLSDGTPCVVARDPDQPEYYGFGADDEEAFQRMMRLRRARIEAYREAAE